jgi:hypothetical protein
MQLFNPINSEEGMILSEINRRDFIKRSGLLGAGLATALMLPLSLLPAGPIKEGVPKSAWPLPERRLGKTYTGRTKATPKPAPWLQRSSSFLIRPWQPLEHPETNTDD